MHISFAKINKINAFLAFFKTVGSHAFFYRNKCELFMVAMRIRPFLLLPLSTDLLNFFF